MGFAAPLIPLLPALLGTGAAAVGAYSSIKGMQDAKKKPAAPAALPDAPTAAGAKTDAAAEIARRRRISALSGGQTDITRGTATVGAGSVGTKSLLGV